MDEEMLRYLAAKTGLGLNYIAKEERISFLLTLPTTLSPRACVPTGKR
ncbi:hypothetical protein [Thermococcus sp. 21S7]|nr:hypothetical protein [Thermococcus sp. 21S7]